jgi:hypothetical protein
MSMNNFLGNHMKKTQKSHNPLRSMRALPTLALVSFMFLTACGGGGGGDSSSSSAPTTTPYVYTSVNRMMTKTTVTHATGNESSPTAMTFTEETILNYGSPIDLSNYLLDNGTHSLMVASNGITAATLATLSANAGNQAVKLGGSTWSYSRYGLFIDKTPNSNGLNTQFIVRNMPYVRYLRYNSAVFTNATYNKAGSMAVGNFLTDTVTDATNWATVTCNVSIAASSTGGEATSIDVTLSACNNNIVTTGYLRLTKAKIDGIAGASLGTFGATSNGNVFTPTFAQGFYGVAGPNSEDLVGHVVVRGTTLVSGVPRTTDFTLAFGARK